MKNIAIIAIGLTALTLSSLALSACAPRYYDRYDRYGYYGTRGHIEYTDRDRYNDPYYSSRDYDETRPYYRDYRRY
jgi:hypothetical protein